MRVSLPQNERSRSQQAPTKAASTQWTSACQIHNNAQRPSKRSGIRIGRPFCSLLLRYSNTHSPQIDGPHTTPQPSRGGQHDRRDIFQKKHLPKTVKIHQRGILFGHIQVQTREIDGLLGHCRTQSSRLFHQAPPNHPPLLKTEHISRPYSGRN